MAEEKELP